jgi:hypothetical protein
VTVAISLGSVVVTSSPYTVPDAEDAVKVGAVVHDRVLATSPFSSGAALVAFRRELVEGGRLQVDIDAASQAALDTATATLITAVTQWSWTWTIVSAGQTYQWRCQPADYSIEPISGAELYGLSRTVRLVIPRQPIPLTGPI